MARLSRSEKQARTRRQLLDAAAAVFARSGYDGASLEEVADAADLSTGAVYSNFQNKQDLLLAVLEDHFGRRIEDINALTATASPVTAQTHIAADQFAAVVRQKPEVVLLVGELWLQCVRDPSLRKRFASRQRALHAAVSKLVERWLNELGVDARADCDEIAMSLMTMAYGFAMAKLAEPTRIKDDFYEHLVSAYMRGLAEPGAASRAA